MWSLAAASAEEKLEPLINMAFEIAFASNGRVVYA
jgi:hypothetical protein